MGECWREPVKDPRECGEPFRLAQGEAPGLTLVSLGEARGLMDRTELATDEAIFRAVSRILVHNGLCPPFGSGEPSALFTWSVKAGLNDGKEVEAGADGVSEYSLDFFFPSIVMP